jgi:hypothetical protein
MRRSSTRLAAGELPPAEIGALSYGWGNEGFSAENAFLTAVVRHASRSTGPILECGSGLSTVLMAVATRSRQTPMVSLENDRMWAERVRRELAQQGARASAVEFAPLRDYGNGYLWYDADLSRMPGRFSLVVCDGPPGDTLGGRYGLVPVMREHFAPGCVILLDDAQRDAERTIAERWARELGASLALEGDDDRAFAVLALPS